MLADFRGVNSAAVVSFSQAVHTMSLSPGIAVPSTLPGGSRLQQTPRSADESHGTEIHGQGCPLAAPGCFCQQTESRGWLVLRRPFSPPVGSGSRRRGSSGDLLTLHPDDVAEAATPGRSPGIAPGTASTSAAHGRSSSPRDNIASPSFPV